MTGLKRVRAIICQRALPVLVITGLGAGQSVAAQEVLRLRPDLVHEGAAEVVRQEENGNLITTDVVDPTMTVYLPDPQIANGTAIIIAPGGAMRLLSEAPYESSTAKWLNDRGIAAFVLHYRTLPTSHELIGTMTEMYDFPNAKANPFPDDPVMAETIDLAISDAHHAMRLVHANAQSWHIDPERIGMLGVSAGGGVGIGALVTADEDVERPAFFISSFGPSLVNVEVPANKPPLFIAVRQFHPNVARALVALYEVWTAAEAPAELHIYDQLGGTPFLPQTGEWLDEAYDWLSKRGFVPTASDGQDDQHEPAGK